jgi:hypothetical protein
LILLGLFDLARANLAAAARAHALGVETPILNLARTHVAAYEIGRTRAAADDVLTGELHVPMADVAVA